ncbi:MAG: glycosyltransferase 87 family protein [Planctomycetota bacterium]
MVQRARLEAEAVAEPDRRARRPLWWWAVLALAAIAGGVAFLRKGPSELPVYVVAGERMLHGAEIYLTTDAKPFTYPPFFALPFVPFVWLPAGAWRPLWYAITLAAFAAVVVLLRRFYTADFVLAPRARRAFWVVVALLGLRHVLAIFENQSHDMVVLLCTVAASLAWARGVDGRAGAWAGLGAACKATPGLFGVPFLLQGGWRAALAATVVGAAATLLPDLVLPRADGQLWVTAWVHTMLAGVQPGAAADLGGTWTAGSILNQSLSGTLYRLTTPVPAGDDSPWVVDAALVALDPAARHVVVSVGQALVLALVAWLARPGVVRRAPFLSFRDLRLAQAAAVACGMVLLSPMSSKSHFGVLVLPAALAASLLCRGRRDPWLVAFLSGSFVAGTITTKGLVGSRVGNVLLGYGAVTWSALLLLLATARCVRLLRTQVPASSGRIALD